MLLAIDIGNTQVVLGVYEGEALVHDFRVGTVTGRTADEYHALFHSLLVSNELDPEDVDGAILASVVPLVTDSIVEAVDRAFDVRPLVVGPGIKTGVSIRYEDPREVGADRIVNAVAVSERYGSNVVVVDFGTATTFDCIGREEKNGCGVYLGGAIVPGIHVSAEALFQRAAKLPKVDIAKPPSVIGRNTVNSIQAGLVFGYVALVDGLVRRIWGEMGGPCPVVATGGLAPLIQPESETIEEVDEFLTLDGLRILYDRQS